jgi:hypothetical protein
MIYDIIRCKLLNLDNDMLISILLDIDNDISNNIVLDMLEYVREDNYLSRVVVRKCNILVKYNDVINILYNFLFYENYINRVIMYIRDIVVDVLLYRYEISDYMSYSVVNFVEGSIIDPMMYELYNNN